MKKHDETIRSFTFRQEKNETLSEFIDEVNEYVQVEFEQGSGLDEYFFFSISINEDLDVDNPISVFLKKQKKNDRFFPVFFSNGNAEIRYKKIPLNHFEKTKSLSDSKDPLSVEAFKNFEEIE